MHSHLPVRPPSTPPGAANTVRSLARRLHRAALSESLASSLPVLRRIISTQALHGVSLPQLRRQRSIVQRKHVLRMLAIEAGFSGWEAYSLALKTLSQDQLTHFEVHREKAGHLNLWFSSREEAQAHAGSAGGRVLEVSGQGVLLTHEPSAPPRADTPRLDAPEDGQLDAAARST